MTEFTTKDSGQHAQYASGMRRDSQDGKPRFDLIRTKLQPYEEQMIYRYAMLLARGAEKYDARNWEEGDSEEELERAEASLLRHTEQLLAGQTDEDHAAAVWFNTQAIEYFRWRIAQKKAATSSPDWKLEIYVPSISKELMELVFGGPTPTPSKQDFVQSGDEDFWKAANDARKAHQDAINAWHNRPQYATMLPTAPYTVEKRRVDGWLARYGIEFISGDLGDTYDVVDQHEFFFRLNRSGNVWKQQSGVLDESAGLD